MAYELLALDVDGVLVGPDNRVPPALADAVAEADRSLRVVLATGRSYSETLPVWRQLDLPRPHEPLVLIGGALVAEPDAGRTLREQSIPRDAACAVADALNASGYSAAVIVDAWRNDVEYYLAESDDAQSVLDRWFAQMDVELRRVPRLADVADLPRPLRINACVDPADAGPLARRLAAEFDGRLNVHAILAPNYGVTIVEAFAAGVSKWAALQYVAQRRRLGPRSVVAVGDDVNDVEMLRHAGLGAAMADGSELLRAEADVVVENGLAAFIDDVVAGRYD
jgi:hypothetical protein